MRRCVEAMKEAREVEGARLVAVLLAGVAVALSVQIIGALLVLALLVTPAAAAMSLTASPGRVVVLSVVFAEAAMLAGLVQDFRRDWSAT